jgi:hypothetical protein
MVNIKTLLPDLQDLMQELAEDLLARAKSDSLVDAGLRDAFQQIEKGGRTAQVFEVWRDDYLDQVAVAWVLACVFVRFLEDNDLIEECWLSGQGQRRKLAEDTHELFFREHRSAEVWEYFLHVFRDVGKIPAAKDLFAEGKTPLWAIAPTGDMAIKLLKFWREMDAESGHLKRSFKVESGDTRFLGDLYQELSIRAQKKFALLQTPVFVEEFILDRTLTPALAEFGLDEVRMIDPTCGSGHFLLGGFARLFRECCKQESNEIKAVQKALDGVWGVDINPFAVAIARFRLIVAAVQVCGIKRLKQAPGWNVHLATGDSLLFGSRWNSDGTKREEVRYLDDSWAPEIYACEDKEAVKEVLGQQYQVVVGNPPYIIVRDRTLNAAYRQRYATCAGKYSLAVPFAERFLDLCQTGGTGKSGYVGMITSNSFMKREFGKKLIENFFSKIDLTHVLDTSGAYIPGHGTPTVLLFARNRKPTSDCVRAVLGIKGEPATPEDASHGFVWNSIVKHADIANAQDEFTSSADIPRSTFNSHPWSIGGGGAAELKEQIDEIAESRLNGLVTSIGFASFPGQDDAFVLDAKTCRRLQFPSQVIRGFVYGEIVRDWQIETDVAALAPYDDRFQLLDFDATATWAKHLWCFRISLEGVVSFGGKTRKELGDKWWGWYRWIPDKYRTPLSITFAEVASHNHFVLDRGGKVFKQTAPVIKLPIEATEDDHLALLGFLNSSISCFYMKQVSHQKQMMGGDGIRISSRAKVPYQFAGTRLQELPIPDSFNSSELRTRLIEITRRLERCALRLYCLTAERAIHEGIDHGEQRIREIYGRFIDERFQLRSVMVFLQEEIDFTCYTMFGLADHSLFCNQWEWPKSTRPQCPP